MKISQTPVKASGFLKLPEVLRNISLANGIYPVSDVFWPAVNDESKVLLLFGGYGSGKSVFIVDKLIDLALGGEYFRCFYGRKIYDTVRISVFLTITDRIEERGLSHLFHYSKADNSSMIIKCNLNNSSFTPFGADNPDKLKSVKDPSHILCEELDQFSLRDFGVLTSRLRTPKINTKFYGLFNTTSVLDDHWIRDVFFSEKSKERLKDLSVTKIFCNYNDNYFINKEEYQDVLWLAAAFNEKKYEQIANGLWGTVENINAFCYTFNREKHVRATEINRHWELKLSFDFNRDPITCLVAQDNGIDQVNFIEQIKLPNSNIYELCDYIKAKYGNMLMLVTGDATGRASSALTRDNLNYFRVIKAQLNLGDRQMRQPASNPPLLENRVLVNAAFHHLDISIDPVNCKGLIFDLEHAAVLPDGTLDKTDRKDPTKQLDALDCARYYFNTFFKHILKR